MGGAYTPGLRVAENVRLHKRRVLPLKGEVKAREGDAVNHDQVVASTFLPGKVHILNVANRLGVDQADVPGAMIRKEGERIAVGETIARSSSFFGMFKAHVESTVEGTIESISGLTGQVIVRGDPEPVSVMAYVDGKVTEVIPNEGVVVETVGAYIQGIFGVGGETFGEITIACAGPREVLQPELLKPEHKGKIVVGGSLVTNAALKRARELGIAGVVVGGFDDQDLRELLGYDLGVAITGHEELGITLIVTEGFGQIDMAPRTFAMLKSYAGKRASINGATQIRAGVIRPEIIIPVTGAEAKADDREAEGSLEIGTRVRIIRAPHFGVLGRVSGLPHEPTVLESGSKARVAEVSVEDGGRVVVLPRANLERIEE